MSEISHPLRSQGGVWRCAVTALEYLTGIERDEIARAIGHDGKPRPPSVQRRIAEGATDPDLFFTFVGVLDAEIQWWAARCNLPFFSLTSREELMASCDPEKAEDILHPLASVPTSAELLRFADGKCCLITVPLPEIPDRRHVVAWLGDRAIDPMHGMERGLRPQDVLALMVFPSIDPFERRKALFRQTNHLDEKLARDGSQ
jgi:hypothetical protein